MPTNLMLGVALGSPAVSGVSIESQILSWPEIIAWWDYRYGITLSGSQVTSWADRKAGYAAEQGTSASRPAYSSTGYGGGPGITFDGTDDCLTCTDAALLAALPDGAEAGNLAAVVSQGGTVADAAVRVAFAYGEQGVSTGRSVQRVVDTGANRARFSVSTSGGAVAATETTVNMSTRHFVTGEFTGTQLRVTIDEAAASLVSASPNTTNSRLRIGSGALSSPTAFWLGAGRHYVAFLPLSTEKQAIFNAYFLAQRTP